MRTFVAAILLGALATSAHALTYEEKLPACLACHKPDGSPPCPISPRRDCIGCHMPALDTGQGILFTDHWIRVRNDR